MGQGIYDIEQYSGSKFTNNLIFNTRISAPTVLANMGENFYHPWSEDADIAEQVSDSENSFNLELEQQFFIPNFSQTSNTMQNTLANTNASANVTASEFIINFEHLSIKSFDTQDKDGDYQISDNGGAITLYGNTWKSVPVDVVLTPETVLELEVKSNGLGEIVGIAFENDNALTSANVYKFAGSQKWSNDTFKYSRIDEFETLSIPVGSLNIETFDRLVLVMDDDKPASKASQVSFKNLRFLEPRAIQQRDINSVIRVGKWSE